MDPTKVAGLWFIFLVLIFYVAVGAGILLISRNAARDAKAYVLYTAIPMLVLLSLGWAIVGQA